MDKVSRDKAEQEINSWLDFRRVKSKKREENQSAIDTLVDAVCEGLITIDDKTFVLTQKLEVPIEAEKGGVALSELKYKPRIKAEAIQLQMTNVKATDPMGVIMAYISAITSQPRALVKMLDSEDYNLAGTVVIFFL